MCMLARLLLRVFGGLLSPVTPPRRANKAESTAGSDTLANSGCSTRSGAGRSLLARRELLETISPLAAAANPVTAAASLKRRLNTDIILHFLPTIA